MKINREERWMTASTTSEGETVETQKAGDTHGEENKQPPQRAQRSHEHTRHDGWTNEITTELLAGMNGTKDKNEASIAVAYSFSGC